MSGVDTTGRFRNLWGLTAINHWSTVRIPVPPDFMMSMTLAICAVTPWRVNVVTRSGYALASPNSGLRMFSANALAAMRPITPGSWPNL